MLAMSEVTLRIELPGSVCLECENGTSTRRLVCSMNFRPRS